MPDLDVNRVVLSGRLVHEPDRYALSSGEPVCFLRLACLTGHALSGSEDYRCNYFDVIVIGCRTRGLVPCLHEGRRVLVRGRLECEQWEAGAGPERETVSVFAERIELLAPARHRVAAAGDVLGAGRADTSRG